MAKPFTPRKWEDPIRCITGLTVVEHVPQRRGLKIKRKANGN